MTSSSELARVAALRARFAGSGGGVRVGIGDDAAVLEMPSTAESLLVWTVDAQVEGTHFRTDWASWEDIGWRSFMAAASDLAAMGAEPMAALSSLVLAPSVDDEALEALGRGQAAASAAALAPVVGGNLARGTETSVTTTLLGRAATPVLRSGARPGDGLWLAGTVGLAGIGLALLSKKMQNARIGDAASACVHAWRRPVARLAEGRVLAGIAHAAIDLSDGLAHDAWQLAEASGVRLVLDLASVLAAGGEALAAGAAALGDDPAEHALYGGEDYALLAASPRALPGFLPIGVVEAHDGGARVRLRTAQGIVDAMPRGFDHFT